MADGLARLAQILNATLELNATLRRAAEQELLALESQPGFGVLLIQLVASSEATSEIRIAAAVAIKNFVKRSWSESAEQELPSTEQEAIREAALQAMFASSGNLQKQLSHTVFLIAKRDFPERWPGLIQALSVHLSGNDLERLLATLSTMDQLFRKYRYESKSTQLWSELKMCLLSVQEPLTQLFEKMLEFIPQQDSLSPDACSQWLEVLLMIVRCFHSLSSQDLPEYFEDNLGRWMCGFQKLLSVKAEIQSSSAGESTSLDKLKAEICSTATLYAQRYEEEIKPYMPELIQTIWSLLVQTNNETRYDGMVCSALDFLSAICQRPHYEDMFRVEGVLRTITIDVAVKNLTLRAEDIELFEDEALEYMKKDIEGTDSGTRRRGAIDLVRSLCKRFEQAIVPILSEAVASSMGSDSSWQQKDVVYCLVTAMATKAETARSGATSTSQLIDVVDFFSNIVRNDVCISDVNLTPIIKADAIKFIVTFRNQLPPEVLVEAMNAFLRLFGSSHVQVHKYAAWAIERLLLVKRNEQIVFSAGNVPVAPLLSAIVACFDADPKAQNSAYLIKALMRVVAIIDDATAAAGGQIASRLVTMVEQATKNPADPVHTHFLFETMCILIRKTSAHVSGGLEKALLPLVENVLAQDIQDLVPYALQITGVLLADTVARAESADSYFAFLPFLLRPELWARSTNVPAALSVIETYLKAAPERVMREHGQILFTQYSRLMASKNLDNYGFQLANAILPYLEHASDCGDPFSVLLNNMFARIQKSKTQKFSKLFLVFVARFVIVRGAEQLYKAMESIQSNMFRMVVEKVIVVNLAELRQLTTADDKRTFAIGYGQLLADCSGQLGDLFGTLASNLVAAVEAASVSINFGVNLEDEQASMYNADGEFTNPFCKLANAAKQDLLLPHITNYKAFLGDCIVRRACGQQPALSSCIPDEVKNVLQTYVAQS